MARFDIYANPDRSEREHTPFILDLQNSYLDRLETFALHAESAVSNQISNVHPVVTIAGQACVVDMPMMATFPKRGLGRPVTNLRSYQLDLQSALDALLGDY